MLNKDKVVAIGLLTQHDVDRLGAGFARMFPIDDANDFQDLVDAIDRADNANQASRTAQRHEAAEESDAGSNG